MGLEEVQILKEKFVPRVVTVPREVLVSREKLIPKMFPSLKN